ncbi:MAG TPA: ABC transporter permease [Streptosporangiaceae bacterium]|nr:ABC transporter permease [Streptosporangiaceae bacterium]
MRAALAQTWWMTHRQLKALARQPAVIVITLVQPAVWLFLFGSLFRRITELPGFGTGSYLDYLVPGVVVMNAISSSMWSGMGAIEEIERGITNRFLITPVSRAAIMNASVITNGVSIALQSAIIVVLGWAGGARYPGGIGGVAVLIVTSVLLGTVFSALSNAIGMTVRQRETIIGLSIFLLLPLTFLSSAFMAKNLMPQWMRHVAAFNPVNWSLDATRSALSASPHWRIALEHGGWLLVLAVVMVWLSTLTFRGYQKSV